MKKHLLVLFAALLSLAASAQTKVEIDGIWYNLTPKKVKQAEVTYKGSSYDEYTDEYSGSITIPATVTYEGVNYSVTSIGRYAFYYCSSLKSITIPEGVTSIGDGAFEKCSSLTAITIPEGVTSIGRYAFQYCGSLKSITIPENSQLTSIGDHAFYYCSYLTTINIPEGVTSIGMYAFKDCIRLTTITIPENSQLTSIGNHAFENCSKLTAITIPEGVTSIGGSAFRYCGSLKTVINYSDLNIKRGSSGNGYVGYYADRVIHVDEWIDGYAFKTVDGVHYLNGYMGNDTELTLPNSYNNNNYQIGDEAFRKCSSLTAITIPEGVTSIGSSAFSGCSSLTTITIPEDSKLTSIGNHAFDVCSSLTAITIPEGVTSIGNSAFSGCSSLTSITIPEGVTSIENYAFEDCSSLTAINIPEGVTSIGYGAFSGCSSLTTITITEDSKLTSIESWAFEDCSSLTAITIPKGVTSIGSSAFRYCRSLKSVINFSDLNIQRGSSDNGYAGYYANRVIHVDDCIDGYAFKTVDGVHYLNCYIGNDTELTLPNSYNNNNYQIGDSAFYGCSSLTTIVLPKNLKNIGSQAFAYCSELLDVYCYAEEVPSTESNAFDGSYIEYTTLHVPASALETYKITSPWSNFGTIVSLTDEEMGIEDSELNIQNSETIYDLRGRRVEKAEKGIYIVNGKKVVIK